MNIVLTTALLLAADRLGLSLNEVLAVMWCWWLVFLPCNTWKDYLAAMSFDRLKHGGTVVLPEDEEEHANEPDADFVVRWVLWLPAALKNLALAQVACIFYFRTLPKWGDVGLTKLINRLVSEGGERGRKALAVRTRWLSRYDRRGIHT